MACTELSNNVALEITSAPNYRLSILARCINSLLPGGWRTTNIPCNQSISQLGACPFNPELGLGPSKNWPFDAFYSPGGMSLLSFCPEDGAIYNVSASSEFMGKTFQAAQLTHERFLTIDHACKLNFHRPLVCSTIQNIQYSTYSTTHQRSMEVQFGRYQKYILQE